jgi:hypothetical protein
MRSEGVRGALRRLFSHVSLPVCTHFVGFDLEFLSCSLQLQETLHRGSNSCSLRVTSALNGRQYYIKYFGNIEALDVENEVLSSGAGSVVCPELRQSDTKEHRHVLQSRFIITPAYISLEDYIRANPMAFVKRNAQVWLPSTPIPHFTFRLDSS